MAPRTALASLSASLSASLVAVVVAVAVACSSSSGTRAGPGDGGPGGEAATGGARGGEVDAAASGAGGGVGSGGRSGVAGGAADGSAATANGGACKVCTGYGAPAAVSLGTPDSSNLSGAAFGVRNPDVLFAHNDASEAVLYALGGDGALLARFALPDAEAVDIEDVGVGPCTDGTCIYLADFGGNRSARTEYAILRTPEPDVASVPSAEPVDVPFERFRFAYDDGALHNAESLLVDPATGALYVITKVPAGNPSTVYRLPHPLVAGVVNRADRVAQLGVPASSNREATAASAHPCGRGFLLRTYDALYEFRTAEGAAFEDAFDVTPVLVPAATERQSEAVAYRPDGRGYVTAGEGAATLYASDCE